jgi:hypothetical protein
MLNNHIKRREAVNASSGWGGDKLAFCQNNTDYFFVLKTKWDSSKDENEFFDAYKNMIFAIEGKPLLNEMDRAMWEIDGEYIYLSSIKDDETIVLGSSNFDILKDGISSYCKW